MAKKKEEKVEKKPTFDYQKYIEENIIPDYMAKGFLFYVITNNLTFKNSDEVDKAYKKFKTLGGE